MGFEGPPKFSKEDNPEVSRKAYDKLEDKAASAAREAEMLEKTGADAASKRANREEYEGVREAQKSMYANAQEQATSENLERDEASLPGLRKKLADNTMKITGLEKVQVSIRKQIEAPDVIRDAPLDPNKPFDLEQRKALIKKSDDTFELTNKLKGESFELQTKIDEIEEKVRNREKTK